MTGNRSSSSSHIHQATLSAESQTSSLSMQSIIKYNQHFEEKKNLIQHSLNVVQSYDIIFGKKTAAAISISNIADNDSTVLTMVNFLLTKTRTGELADQHFSMTITEHNGANNDSMVTITGIY